MQPYCSGHIWGILCCLICRGFGRAYRRHPSSAKKIQRGKEGPGEIEKTESRKLTKLSAVEILEKKFQQKAQLKEKELELKRFELELKKKKLEIEEAKQKEEEEERILRLKMELYRRTQNDDGIHKKTYGLVI